MYEYVKFEVKSYKDNKKTLKRLLRLKNPPTREIEVITLKLKTIEAAFERLSKEDKEAAQIIVVEGLSQGEAEFRGYSKNAYYNALDRIIYAVAREADFI